jgi:hypothetical protein
VHCNAGFPVVAKGGLKSGQQMSGNILTAH